jgi:hypothetical protein
MEENLTVFYSLAALYIALTEAMSAATGQDIEPLTNHLISEMLPLMPPAAADLCGQLVMFAGSRAKAPSAVQITRALN